MPIKGYKQLEEHKAKHLEKIKGPYNGNWSGQKVKRDKVLKTAEDKRKSHLKAMYGITVQDYNRMFDEQDGKCAICGVIQEVSVDSKGRVKSTLYIDHDHQNNKVRGLLCDSCNLGLGRFKDNPELLRKAIDYLKIK